MPHIPTREQISAGGVAYRQQNGHTEVALISVGPDERWQLPKGQVDPGESTEETAMREVHEEAGIKTELIRQLETIEYWFYVGKAGKRLRVHKYVHFYLLQYLSGDPSNHDHEVNEARWVELERALEMLTFENEVDVVRKAQAFLQAEAQEQDSGG